MQCSCLPLEYLCKTGIIEKGGVSVSGLRLERKVCKT